MTAKRKASPDAAMTLVEAQRRKESALAKMREHQLDVVRGKYVAVTAVQSGWSRIVSATRNAMLELPSNARLRLQLTEEQARGLEKMVRETLTRVAMQEQPKYEPTQ
jgi:hypothetical protein